MVEDQRGIERRLSSYMSLRLLCAMCDRLLCGFRLLCASSSGQKLCRTKNRIFPFGHFSSFIWVFMERFSRPVALTQRLSVQSEKYLLGHPVSRPTITLANAVVPYMYSYIRTPCRLRMQHLFDKNKKI